MTTWLVLLVLTCFCSDHVIQLTAAGDNDGHFLNEWAVEIMGGKDVAKRVADEYGYRFVRSIEGIPDHYVLQRSDVPHRSRRSADHHTRKLTEDKRVGYVAQQEQLFRAKRDFASRDVALSIVERGENLDDPELDSEWYLNEASSNKNRREAVRADLRVKEVWKKGITGKGVVVTIIDDGLENNHTDLALNYDPKASYDFNDDDPDPFPRYDITNENKHGTRCAGEVAMVANNKNCGVGIAFDSKIGGIRILDGRLTDSVEADSLTFQRDYIDIYSVSWGPQDDGKTVEGPSTLAQKALEFGIELGRGGKGSIFSWASGNGGRMGDNCNCDGYTSSIYTISVSSASQYGKIPWYSEKCASTMTTTYSSGTASEGKVVSADLHNKCTDEHSGTSAAAPMAAGIFALLLEANPDLTWRDVQHIVVHTSRWEPLGLESGWYSNAAGYCVNLAFGFGLMDAMAMVELADPKKWKHVGTQKICTVSPEESTEFPQEFMSGQNVEVQFTTDGCKGQKNEINFLEHVQVVFDADHQKRGNVYAELESPGGTITSLMLSRPYDRSEKGFKEWPLMSVHNWGENPKGVWKFRVGDLTEDSLNGKLNSAKLILYGTTEEPEYKKDSPNPNCTNVDKFVGKFTTPKPTEVTSDLDKKSNVMDDLETALGTNSFDPPVQETSKLVTLLHHLEEEEQAQKPNREFQQFADSPYIFDTDDFLE